MAGHEGIHHFGIGSHSSHGLGVDGAWLQFVCGHCGSQAGAAVIASTSPHPDAAIRWVRCTVCGQGSVITASGTVSPGVPYGPVIAGLPREVDEVYGEARRCMSVGAYTGAELLCRKLLMHVAVDKTGAQEGESFASYIDKLKDAGYITPPMEGWVDLIRQHANDSTHKLPAPDQRRAEGTVWFTAQLLRVVYEMEHLAREFAPPSPPTSAVGELAQAPNTSAPS